MAAVEEEVDTSCQCDVDYPCSYPPCVAERESIAASFKALFAHEPPRMSREEWEDVYRDKPGKAAQYPW